jgi:hypothetical protein
VSPDAEWLLGAVGMLVLIAGGAWVAWRVERWANPPPPPLPQEILDWAAGLPPDDPAHLPADDPPDPPNPPTTPPLPLTRSRRRRRRHQPHHRHRHPKDPR